MASLVEKHPHYLKRRVFQSPYLVYFSGYMWTILLECRADTVEHRTELAKVTNHTGPLYDTLVGSGILVIDNDASTEEANRMLRDYTASLRVEYFWVERISIQGCIGVIDSKQYHWGWLKKSSVNIFCKAENSGINKASLPGCRVCQTHGNILGNMHISVIAHELAHNSITNLGSVSSTEALRARKLILMHRVLKDCPDIMWKENREVDKGATIDHFEAQGWLNADTDNFGVVIKRYFDGKWVPEAANYKYDIITNVNPGVVIVNSPNEYFASIAQCWAQDSKMLLDIAVERFLDGYKESINQILLLAEYYSVGGDTTRFWMHNKKGDVYSFDVDLERDVKGNIISMSVPKATERDPLDKGGAYLVHLDSPHVYEFSVDDDGFVVKIINFPSYIAAAN
ncbi:uncharacterized protein LOC106154895 [Lingula anatina]|uniref:Uncharacterized protein LOC106154895 n=1 Tax=Lingula anatina TaxID=7574 RepID=A0A1S3HIP5_LINAN|nr:uncharacterized protein LOC106154895 [Lingula anatina]|eukprot:XP_013384889.1 uncharacterized protein LOC106154895 [Lingula anatina]